MSCTYGGCESSNTRKISRTLIVYYNEKGDIVQYKVYDLWICGQCLNLFFPSLYRSMPLLLRKRKLPTPRKRLGRPRKFKPARRITKKEIIDILSK